MKFVEKPAEKNKKQGAINKKRPEIYQFSNPAHQAMLNNSTKAVKTLPNKDIDELLKAMHEAMASNVGGGISANQIGKSLQIFLIGPPPMINSRAPSDVFINPRITKASKGRSCFWHGCLSSDGEKFGKVASWNTITIEALDPQGKKFTRDLKGLDAIVAQHEFRHLLGGGYHDHAKEFNDEKSLMRLMFQGKLRMLEVCDDNAPFILDGYKVGETIEEYAQRAGKVSGKSGDKSSKKKKSKGIPLPE
nr:peptide deformylase [Endozoicomonas sp. OPT23]